MEKKGIIEKIKTKFLMYIDFTLNVLAALEIVIIADLHFILPFFPILFLFDFCFFVGYPLFLRFVLKQKWFECTKDNYLELKYILVPWLIMETIVIIYYHNEIMLLQ